MAGPLLMKSGCEHVASTPSPFALGSPFRGTGVSKEGAQLVITFAFETIRVGRLEAGAPAKSGRGDEALRRLSAVPRGILGKSFPNSEYLDQIFSTIPGDEWQAKVIWGGGKLH